MYQVEKTDASETSPPVRGDFRCNP